MCRPLRSRWQRGVSLVEMMIALALGLFIVAVATALLASQLQENRSLTVESRLMQDLRTAADLMTRDLRRAGYWGNAARGAWTQRSAAPPRSNPYAVSDFSVTTTDNIELRYSRDPVENDAVDRNEQFGYRLRGGAIEMQLGADNWQALTDSGSLAVTGFSLLPTAQDVVLGGACRGTCPPGSAASCPPRQQVRSLALRISARSTLDPRVARELRSEVRLRNDTLIGACPRP